MGFINQQEIFDKTNGGLDIILSYFPQAQKCVESKSAKFKVRGTEKTASANLRKLNDGVWVLTDFGSDTKPKNAITIVMEEENLNFLDALKLIASKYNISDVVENTIYKADITDRTAKKNEKEGDFYFEVKKELTEFELKTIGETANADVCAKYNLKSLISYTVIKNGKAIRYASNEQYPIFLYEYETFQKIYQPLNPNKAFRFFYKGTRPKDYIFGLDQVIEEYKRRCKNADDDAKEKDKKIPEIILCSGDRDAINVASLGYSVIWLNSETAHFTGKQYKQIMQYTNILYNLPDIDYTGIKTAEKLGLKFLDIRTIYLPQELKTKRDFRGNPCKDVTDYLKHYKKADFDKLVNVALPLKFWDEEHKYDRQGEYKKTEYKLNNLQAYYFLKVNGFYRIENKNNKEGFDFIQIQENSVRILEDKNDMKAFIHDFLEKRKLPNELRNEFFRTTQLSEKSLSNLPKINIDFTNFDKDNQYFFFENCTWQINKNGIITHKAGDIKNHVWQDEIIKHRVKATKQAPFVVTKKEDVYSIDIKDKSCLFFQFLIKASNMYWKKEEAGEKLTTEELQEQDLHLINKIYSLGYLLHNFKDPSKPWCVFAMDSKISDSGSHGGSGKSVCYKAVRQFMQSITFDGRNRRLTENNHIYDRVTEHTDFILIDDANKHIDFGFFFSALTGEMIVNPKSAKSYEIPFELVPKFCITSNYTLNNLDPSTERRLLYTVFSDYFHFNKDDEYKETRTIRDYFGKNLFDDFTQEDWNNFFNFMAYCLVTYLNFEKINPPMESVQLRNLKTEMGNGFQDWADSYFNEENLNTEIPRIELYETFIKYPGINEKYQTPQGFKKKLKAWAKFYGYELNKERIMRNIDGKTTEMLLITAKNIIHTGNLMASTDEDDLPF